LSKKEFWSQEVEKSSASAEREATHTEKSQDAATSMKDAITHSVQ
jgi:hypothetical protein